MNKKLKDGLIILIALVIAILISRGINTYSVSLWDSGQQFEGEYLRGARPYYLERGNVNILMLHSLGGSPEEFSEVADILAKDDYSIYAPLLPGHGTSPKDLEKTSYKEWIEEVDKILSTLEPKDTIIGGVSTGSIIAMHFAQNHDFKGLVIMNTPYELSSPYIKFIPIIKIFKPYHTLNIPPDLKRAGSAYDSVPLTSIEELLELTKQIDLRKIDEPMLIIQSAQDELIENETALAIFSQVSSAKKEILFLNESTHAVLANDDRNKVISALRNFIASS